MKASDIINQLALVLPRLSNKFTTNFNVNSLTRSGTTVTATTNLIHGLTVGKQINIVGAKTPIVITSLTRILTVGTMITATDHDFTQGFSTSLELTGAVETEFNGTFVIIGVQNRRTVTFIMIDTGPIIATGSPLLQNGSSFLKQYNGLHNVATIISTTMFTYEITDTALFTPAAGNIEARTEPRISGAVSVDRIIDAYTKQPISEYWLFVVLGDVTASKSRSIETDATDNQQRSNEYRQQIIQPFTVVVMMPVVNEIASRLSRDEAEDIFRDISRSILFKSFDSRLFSGAQNPVQFVDHGFLANNSSVYMHGYNYEATADITFDDTVGYDDDVAFRDITLNQTIELGTQKDPLIADLDIDNMPLP